MIGDTIAAALPLLRSQAESLMADTCTIRRRTAGTIDPNTNQRATTWTTVYTGRCRLQVDSSVASTRDVESQLLTAQQWRLTVPYAGSAAVRVDDVAEITSQGVTVRIAGSFAQTYATARRFPVETLT